MITIIKEVNVSIKLEALLANMWIINLLLLTNDQKLTQKTNDYTQESLTVMKELLAQGRKEGAIDEKYIYEFLLFYIQAMINRFVHSEVYRASLPFTEDWLKYY